MENEVNKNDIEQDSYTAVIYTDGSCGNRYGGQQNPAFIGSGVHGYLYPEKNVGIISKDNPSNGYVITKKGYLETDLGKMVPKVTPTHYIDGIYSYQGIFTNNVAEVKAICVSIKKLIKSEFNIKHIIVKSDSAYALHIYRELLDDNDEDLEIKKNADLWFYIKNQIKEARELGITIELIKVPGHTNVLGNIITDSLANIARYNSETEVYGEFFYITPNNKYWKPNIKKSPFLTVKSLFFTHSDRMLNPYRYVIMDYVSNNEIGTNDNTAMFGLLYTKGQFTDVEEILDFDKDIVKGNYSLSELDMRTYYSQEHNNYRDLFGKMCYLPNKRNNGIMVLNNILTCTTFQGLAKLAFNRTLELEHTYRNYISFVGDGNSEHDIIDITDLIYQTNEKGKRICHLDQKAKNISYDYDNDGKKIKIILSLGTEIPARNMLKNLEKEIQHVYLEVIKKDKILQTNTIVVTEDVIGVYTNFFTRNIIL